MILKGRSKKQKVKNKDSTLYLMRRIFRDYMVTERRSLFIAAVCMLVVAVTTALQMHFLQPILDRMFTSSGMPLYLGPAILVINSIIKAVASFFESVNMRMLGQKIVANIQLQLYKHLVYADMSTLNKYPSGNLISKFTNDINTMRRTIIDIFTNIIRDIMIVIGLIGVMFYHSYQLAMIALVFFPIACLPIIRLGKKMRVVSHKMQEQLSDFTERLDETFQNIIIIKSYCREKFEILKAQNTVHRYLELYRRGTYFYSMSSPIMEILTGVAIAAVLLYGSVQVSNGKTTPGSFFAFIGSILTIYRPLKSISRLNTTIQEGLSSAKRIFNLLDEQSSIVEKSRVKITPVKTHNIKFRDVCFSYAGEKVLNNMSLSIEDGKTVALVGTSGSGKSTIFRLLQRLYDPESGAIYLDEQNIKDMRLSYLRHKIAVVTQEVTLFDTTIYENIRYGRLDATEEDVIDAAMAAAAHDFIDQLPSGYYTNVGQSGFKLSGGEKQRIAIARAILKNAPVLLLDEATSALDSMSETKIKVALDYLKQGRTTIVIAHRLATIENADMIYVISDGHLKEKGTHSELIGMNGEYSVLHKQYKG